MLILSRKPNEAVHIDDTVVVRVLRIKENAVLLGFEAPQEVRICREELKQPKSEEQSNAG